MASKKSSAISYFQPTLERSLKPSSNALAEVQPNATICNSNFFNEPNKFCEKQFSKGQPTSPFLHEGHHTVVFGVGGFLI